MPSSSPLPLFSSPGARHFRLWLLLATTFLVLVMCAAIAFGSTEISFSALGSLFDPTSPSHDLHSAVILGIRLPRVLFGALVGATLGVTGALFQAILRNPLAEPYILGVSGGAAFGATLFLAFTPTALIAATSSSLSPLLQGLALPFASFLGAVAVIAFLLFYLRSLSDGDHATQLLLVGVVLNMFAGACITFVQATVSAQEAQAILFFLMGSLEVAGYPPVTLLVAGSVVLLALFAIMMHAPQLNVIACGAEEAELLGIDVRRILLRLILLASFAVSVTVAYTGMIGFVGLIIPHAIRRVVGPNHLRLLPLSALLGASFLLICDLIARTSFGLFQMTLPIGATTALIGAPIFVAHLRSLRH